MIAQPAKVAYITGSSRGIGKAIAELLLEKDYNVIGLSRTNEIEHPNFTHHPIDLSDIETVKNFQFSKSDNGAILINNAGLLGEIGPIGEIQNLSIHKTMNVNTITPQILTNNFIKVHGELPHDFHIINISSGAGKRPITSWATYCASKAALDLFSETLAEELDWKQKSNWYVHSVAPGVVDTKMQEEIRSAAIEDFAHVQNFIDYKKQNELFSPKYVAEKLWVIIQNPCNFKDVVMSVRDM